MTDKDNSKKISINITEDNTKTLCETDYLNLYDLQCIEGHHYINASRRKKDSLVALKSDDEFKALIPDAVTCFMIIKTPLEEPKLLLSYEFRYPVGQFLLSPPAGLIDEKDRSSEDPLISTAKREIFEETGIRLKDTDKIELLCPCSFSSPGMSDESNALVAVRAELDDLSSLTQSGAEGTECFDGFELVSKEEAEKLLSKGTDKFGNSYSVYTFCALMYFLLTTDPLSSH